LAVLSAVPLALLGPVIALTSLGVANNLYTQIGIILMIREAAIDAARSRFRPILMTSFAFGLGVVPLVLATGAGANGRISLGLSVLSGIIASTCFAVLFARPSSRYCKSSRNGAKPARRHPLLPRGQPNSPSLVDLQSKNVQVPGGVIDVETAIDELVAVAVVNLRPHEIGEANLPTAKLGEWQRQPALTLISGIVDDDDMATAGRSGPGVGDKPVRGPVAGPSRLRLDL